GERFFAARQLGDTCPDPTCDRLIVFIVSLLLCSLAVGVPGSGVGRRALKQHQAKSGQAALRTRASLVWAWRAHLKHSSAIARYWPAVFMKRCAFPLQDFLRVSRACLP